MRLQSLCCIPLSYFSVDVNSVPQSQKVCTSQEDQTSRKKGRASWVCCVSWSQSTTDPARLHPKLNGYRP